VLQLHPTRRCNLRCVHCYSLSGPEERGELDAALLRRVLDDAAAEAFNVAGFSGGEPTLYRPLAELLAHAKSVGLTTTVTTNGMLLTRRLLGELAGLVDVLAISLDGPPESHNAMRASPLAFSKMAARLDDVRASGIPFGFIFTLTQHNLDELDWVARFALDAGASLLQIHPLEEVGRARELLAGQRPDAVESAWAHLEAARIAEVANGRLRVQLDVVDARVLAADAARVFAAGAPPEAAPLAEVVSPLVVEPDGTVVPLEFGFPRRFALGNLHEDGLRALGRRWRRERLDQFLGLCRAVHTELVDGDGLPFANWYDAVAERAAVSAAELVR
jgi:MoaA/NifB/PqqE/SkfB family radical SAM enzyme